MLTWPGIADHLGYAAVFSNDKGDPLYQLEHEQVRNLDAVKAAEFELWIGKQIVGKPLRLAEGDVCLT